MAARTAPSAKNDAGANQSRYALGVARPMLTVTTALGIALRERRESLSTHEAAAAIGITQATLSRVERGAYRPSVLTALALSRWLGWTMEQVLEAASTPAARRVAEFSPSTRGGTARG